MEMDYNSPMTDDTSFIPADYNYFRIQLMSENPIQNFPYGIYIILFKDHSVDFNTLLDDLYKLLQIDKNLYPIENIRLTLSQGNLVNKSQTADHLRKKLFRQSASGITLKAILTNGIVNESASIYYYSNETEYHGENFQHRLFILLNNKQPFYVYMQKSTKAKELQNIIIKNLNDFYGNNIQGIDVEFYKTDRQQNQQSSILQWITLNKIKNIQIQNYLLDTDKNIIGIKVIKEGTKWPTKQVNNEQFLIIHLFNQHSCKFKFSQIAQYTIKMLLESIKINQAENFGLKMVNQIFKPCQLVKDMAKYFEKHQGKFIKNIQATQIDQKQIFYRVMEKMEGNFKLDKNVVTKQKQDTYDRCRQIAREKFNKKYKFKDEYEVSPITFYTSSLQVIDPLKEGKSFILYRCLNENLRDARFGMLMNPQNDWKYQFTATLNKSLMKLPYYGKQQFKQLYRGIKNLALPGQIGQIHIQKQFTSTTYEQKKAEKWIKGCSVATLLTIKAKNGRLIQDFSFYQHQKQVLIMPYTQFKILDKKITYNPYVVHMTLEEVSRQQYRSNSASYILWIDDKLKQGYRMIENLNIPMCTTFLYQIKSNKELLQWISNNKDIINNQKTKIGVITNMRRTQDGIENSAAGAQTIKLLQEHMKNCEKILYIWNIQGAKKILVQNNINPQQIKVINKRQQLIQFIAKVSQPQNKPYNQSTSTLLQKKIKI